jgi:hypothetical protein
MAAREFVRIMKEVDFGVFNPAATPVKNTDFINVELMQSNAMTVRPRPRLWGPIRTMDTWNRRVKRGSAQSGTEGQLTTFLYPEQAAFIFSLVTLTGTLLNKLPTFTIDHAFLLEDTAETYYYRRYLGCMVEDLGLAASVEPADVLFKLTLGIKGKNTDDTITTTDLPDPVGADFPVGNPFQLSHMSTPGYLRLAATSGSRPEFANFDLRLHNIIDQVFMEAPTPTRLKWCGRDLNWSDRLMFLTATDRAAFETVTPVACAARIDNGTKSVTLALGANNVESDVADDLTLDRHFEQNLSWENQYDRAAGADFAVTVA